MTAALTAAAAAAAAEPVRKRSAAVPAAAALCRVHTSSSYLQASSSDSNRCVARTPCPEMVGAAQQHSLRSCLRPCFE